ncbi:MAG: hypothetical protein M5R36_21395 [Deltaproteobacteria bacterium]|nr:hypothetical protein [Deltaproteobacteria bacterium]
MQKWEMPGFVIVFAISFVGAASFGVKKAIGVPAIDKSRLARNIVSVDCYPIDGSDECSFVLLKYLSNTSTRGTGVYVISRRFEPSEKECLSQALIGIFTPEEIVNSIFYDPAREEAFAIVCEGREFQSCHAEILGVDGRRKKAALVGSESLPQLGRETSVASYRNHCVVVYNQESIILADVTNSRKNEVTVKTNRRYRARSKIRSLKFYGATRGLLQDGDEIYNINIANDKIEIFGRSYDLPRKSTLVDVASSDTGILFRYYTLRKRFLLFGRDLATNRVVSHTKKTDELIGEYRFIDDDSVKYVYLVNGTSAHIIRDWNSKRKTSTFHWIEQTQNVENRHGMEVFGPIRFFAGDVTTPIVYFDDEDACLKPLKIIR